MSRTHSIDIAGDPSAQSAQSERHSWRLLSRTLLSVTLRGDFFFFFPPIFPTLLPGFSLVVSVFNTAEWLLTRDTYDWQL